MEVLCGDEKSNSRDCLGELVLQRKFSAVEMAESSTYRELVALWELYHLRAGAFAGAVILHYTDNFNVSLILKRGSNKPLLQSIALDIFTACNKSKVVLQSQWLPRSDPRMIMPDFYSRERDLSDWGLETSFFEELRASLPFELTVDLFGSEYNAKLPVYFSEDYFPTAMGVNAFAQDWSKFGPGLCNPPPAMVASAMSHAIHCGSRGLLVAPMWRAADYWRAICQDGRHLNGVFFDWKMGQFPLMSAPHLNSVLSGIPTFPILCLLFDGKRDNPLRSVVSTERCTLQGCSLCMD
jgi:hypothetical protein